MPTSPCPCHCEPVLTLAWESVSPHLPLRGRCQREALTEGEIPHGFLSPSRLRRQSPRRGGLTARHRRADGTSGTPSPTKRNRTYRHGGRVPSCKKRKPLRAFFFCYFMLSMAFSAKLLSTSASKSTHCAFVSSPASVITVSSRSSAERAIMGAAFHASICR